MRVPFHDTDTWARQSPGGRSGAEAIDENRNIYRYEGLTRDVLDQFVIKSRREPLAWKRVLSGRQRMCTDTPTLPHGQRPHARGPKLHGLIRSVQSLGDSAKKMDHKGSATHTRHAGPQRKLTTHCEEGNLLTTPTVRRGRCRARHGAWHGTTAAPLWAVTSPAGSGRVLGVGGADVLGNEPCMYKTALQF